MISQVIMVMQIAVASGDWSQQRDILISKEHIYRSCFSNYSQSGKPRPDFKAIYQPGSNWVSFLWVQKNQKKAVQILAKEQSLSSYCWIFFGFWLGSRQYGLTCEQEENQDHDHSIPEVQDGASNTSNLEFREEIMDGVDEEINGGEAAGQE